MAGFEYAAIVNRATKSFPRPYHKPVFLYVIYSSIILGKAHAISGQVKTWAGSGCCDSLIKVYHSVRAHGLSLT